MTTSYLDSERQNTDLVVEMRGIVKQFPGVIANDHVDFDMQRGEIHALLGENGAGKSTLVNILTGLYRQDVGLIRVNGKEVKFSSPGDAINVGIGMVHQHFMLVPSQTVTENILIGLDQPRFRMNLQQYEHEVSELGQRFGLNVDPRAKIWQLSVGEQQRVEILKVLYRGAQILILDEPTAVLAPQEINVLFDTLHSMVRDGKSVVFISHKLHEVMEISDRITILRKGKVTAAGLHTKDVTQQELAKLMVGRDVEFAVEKQVQQPGEIVLEVENVHAENDKRLPALQGISFVVRSGEILGLAGVAGNGQRELAQVLSGLRKCQVGVVKLNGKIISNTPVKNAINKGVAYIPEDRTHVGSAPNLSVTDNVIMKNYRRPPIAKGWIINDDAATDFAKGLKDSYEISVPTVETPVRLLSGGNLQRVILAREFSGEPVLIVAVQPTRGLDVGAIEGVHRLLLAQREAGSAILLISEELEELFALSDRITVIYEGQFMGEMEEGDIDTIGLMMTGTPLDQIKSQGMDSNV